QPVRGRVQRVQRAEDPPELLTATNLFVGADRDVAPCQRDHHEVHNHEHRQYELVRLAFHARPFWSEPGATASISRPGRAGHLGRTWSDSTFGTPRNTVIASSVDW